MHGHLLGRLVMRHNIIMRTSHLLALGLAVAVVPAYADTQDLDDVREWGDTVRMETCLDAAMDRIPGHPRKLEMKLEDGVPVYEFDMESEAGAFNVECSAVTGRVTEVERQVDPQSQPFQSLAKISEAQARRHVLAVHPGRVVAVEYELSALGQAIYEFDVQTETGVELKIDVNAASGEILEANTELYEIGNEVE